MHSIHGYMYPYPQICNPHGAQSSYLHAPHVYPSWEPTFSGASRFFSPKDCNNFPTLLYPSPFIPHSTPQLSQHHFPGAYPPFPNTWPSYYFPPPPYLDNQGRSHCYGCSKQSSEMQDGIGMKMEEGNPESLTKNNNSCCTPQWPMYPYPMILFPPDSMKNLNQINFKSKDDGSSPPIQWPTYPYPLVCFPPDFMKDKTHQHQDHASLERWAPLEKNSWKSLIGNEEKAQKQDHGEKKMQIPLPIVWMPNYDQPQELKKDVKEANANPTVVEELPSKFKPCNILADGSHHEKTCEKNVDPGDQICQTLPDKVSKLKIIPVKHIEDKGLEKIEHPGKQGDNCAERSNVPEKEKCDNQEKKTDGCGTNKKSVCKTSKFSPVCLRIEPLRRKKTGNFATSSSPPENKEGKDHREEEESKSGCSGDLKECKKDDTIEKVRIRAEDEVIVKPGGEGTPDDRVMEVQNRSTSKKEGGEGNSNELNALSTEDHAQTEIDPVFGTTKNMNEAKSVVDRKFVRLNGCEEVLGHSESEITECKKSMDASDERKIEDIKMDCKLSENDAVLCIQARYRGYQVRRWEPLKKLKQIAIIREHVSSIKQRIHSLETSSEKQLDEKQKLFIGETIMNLLLQLDTVQGLHPSVREIRKSVARDLVSLQEKLDMLCNRADKGLNPEARRKSTFEDYEDAASDTICNDVSDLKGSFSQELYVQPPEEGNLNYFTDDKQEPEMFVKAYACDNSSARTGELIENRGKQILHSDTSLTETLVSGNEEHCCSESGEHINPHPASGDGIVSGNANVSEKHKFQQGEKGEAEKDSGMHDGNAEGVEELHEMQARDGKQLAINLQPFSATSLSMLEERENALEKEEVMPVVEDFANIQGHEPLTSSERSESSQLNEDSSSGNKIFTMQYQETGDGGLLVLDDCPEVYCEEVSNGVQSGLPCLESSTPEVASVERNESENVGSAKKELGEISGHEHVNPEIAVKDDTVGCPAVKILYPPTSTYLGFEKKDGYGKNHVMDVQDSLSPSYMEDVPKVGDGLLPSTEITNASVLGQHDDDDEGDGESLDTRVPVSVSSHGVDSEDENVHQMPAFPVEEAPTPSVERHYGDNPELHILDMPVAEFPKVVVNEECAAVSPKEKIKDVQVPEKFMDVSLPPHLEYVDLEVTSEHAIAEDVNAPRPPLSAGVDLAENGSCNEMVLPIERKSSEAEDIEEMPQLMGGKDLGTMQFSSTTEPKHEMRGAVSETVHPSLIGSDHERKLKEENEQLMGVLEKLLEAGNKQLEMISNLSCRVKGLEKRIARRRKLKMKQHRAPISSPYGSNIAPEAALESAA